MKKYLPDFVVGLTLGIIYFFISTLLDAELLDTKLYITLTKYGVEDNLGFLISGLLYPLIGIFFFLLYTFLPWYKKHHPRTGTRKTFLVLIIFLSAIYLSYLLFLLFAGFAFSLTTGPF